MAKYEWAADGWHKSSFSRTGECVEVRLTAQHVQVRDSKQRQDTVLTFTLGEWRAFLAGVRNGEFELPGD
jgi:Domain of unknown function (DUF397)